VFFALVLTLGLSGCDAINEFLGLGGEDPDDPENKQSAAIIPNPGDTVVEVAAQGDSREWKPAVDGYYLIELWGSQGWNPPPEVDPDNRYGGKGAYVRGILEITEDEVAAGQTLYVTEGVGTGYPNEGYGGGASDVRWGEDTLYGRIIVAAGGGGSHNRGRTDVTGSGYSTGGSGGGLIGGSGSGGDSGQNGGGGSQTAGGKGDGQDGRGGTFGTGGYVSSASESIGSGGGGYWGGGSGGYRNFNGPGGGGSSFISGWGGCVAITGTILDSGEGAITRDTAAKTGSDEEIAAHYSGKVFVPSITIDGIEYTTVMKAGNEEMPLPTGEEGATETGHSGDAYARIIYLGKPSA
jgi:hypothetical protein